MSTIAVRRTNVRALCECAILIALAQILSYIKLFEGPEGGSVTAASMLPIIVIGIRWGVRWGLGSGLVYGLLQATLQQVFAIALLGLVLDYFIAFTVLGFSGIFKNRRRGLIIAVPVCGFLRFVIHYISGIAVWGMYAPEGVPVWYYSLIYNGGYMLPDTVIALIIAILIFKPLMAYMDKSRA